MPQLFDITHWSPQPWYSTGGTRSKKFVQAPDGKFYYFKKSYKTAGRDYFYEFWSEVAASGIGKMLGFNMLTYDIAIDGEEMGCISENMLASDSEELIEGGKYLQAVNSNFDPEIRGTRDMYSFQLVESALMVFKLDSYMEQIVEIIVFDSLIGNSDRHQENWAFINAITLIPKSLSEMEAAFKQTGLAELPPWLQRIFSRLFDEKRKEMRPEIKAAKLYLQKTKNFAPIYDSGSSLGRELTDAKVENMLKDDEQLYAYLHRGTSEIHWHEEKLNHFDLIYQLLATSYAEVILNTIKRVIEKFDNIELEKLIYEIDSSVPKNCNRFKLTEPRKRLMVKLVTLRFEALKSLYNERV